MTVVYITVDQQGVEHRHEVKLNDWLRRAFVIPEGQERRQIRIEEDRQPCPAS